MLLLPEVDAVLISTETAIHADIALKAIALGKVSCIIVYVAQLLVYMSSTFSLRSLSPSPWPRVSQSWTQPQLIPS
jgi:hypothetical protein